MANKITKISGVRYAVRGVLFSCLLTAGIAPVFAQQGVGETFKVWVFSDMHVGTDILHGVESLAEAIRQSEEGMDGINPAPPMDWDIGICLGDFAGGFEAPEDPEGEEVVRQFAALASHNREDIYCIAGNHDATTHEDAETQWWFRKWIDPAGENTRYSGVVASKRPYPVTGSWERYSFRVGNILFLMMSDRNDLPPPVGRGPIDDTANRGGYPAGAVTSETFSWWQQQIEDNPGAIIVSGHHHMLKDTTNASGEWGGFTTRADGSKRPLYHGYNSSGAPIGASYLYFLDDKPDAQAFEGYLDQNNQAIDLWLGAHTHLSLARSSDGRSAVEQKWGVTFVNAAALSMYHNPLIVAPSSRLLTFTEGSDELRIQYYLHTNDYFYPGWYADEEVTVKLSKPFTAR
jgi:hypothetical protein